MLHIPDRFVYSNLQGAIMSTQNVAQPVKYFLYISEFACESRYE